MRKIKFLGLVLACAMAFVACTSGSADNVPSNQTTQTERVEGSVSEFFPFSPNTQYVFSRSGMISDREEIYVTFINGNIMQRNITVAHLEATEVLEYRDGAIILTHAISGGHEFRNLTNEPANIDRVMLKAPLEVGNSWPAFTGDISLGNLQGTSTITDVNVPVSVPYGDFLAIQVTTEFPGGNFSVEYFVRDIGIVKVEYFTSAQNPEGAANTVDETIMLAEINRNVAREITFNKFAPNIDDYYFDIDEMALQMYTNDDLIRNLEQALRAMPAIFSADTVINNIDIQRGEMPTVTLDLSAEYQSFMRNFGSGFESATLSALAITVIDFFGVDAFRVTIDGGNLESGHIVFEDGWILQRNEIIEAFIR